MPLSFTGPLASPTAKLLRANEHLQALIAIDEKLATVDCEVVFTEDAARGIGYFVLHLPKCPAELSTVAGDCLHNLRSALDYLVWQLVLANPPQQPDGRNMFPICSAAASFNGQVKRGRLQGLAAGAVEAVEKLQPFDAPHHPLALLDQLCNADKHRDLHFMTAVASDLEISYSRNGEIYLQTILGNDEVRDGAILGNVGIPLSMARSRPQIEITSSASAFVAFRDLSSEWDDALSVVSALEEIRDHIADAVIPSLEPFLLTESADSL